MALNAHPANGHASDTDLFEVMNASGDARAREVLFERHITVARTLAHRYAGTREMTEDLEQVAAVGLLKAIDRFDPARGIPFRGYAVPTILGELRRHFRDTGWAMRVSRQIQERSLDVRRTGEDLVSELGREPTTKEIAEAVGLTVEQVIEALAAGSATDAASLDEVVSDGETSLNGYDVVGDEDPGYRFTEDRLSMRAVLEGLDERERRILGLRFVANMTQVQIARTLGVSQMQISRLLRKSLAHAREAFVESA